MIRTTWIPGSAAGNRLEQEGIDIAQEYYSDTINVMVRHESVRRFTAQEVPEGALNAILVAARSAPTSSNLQAYSMVVVRDKERRGRIAELVGDQQCVVEAPVFVAFCADIFRLKYVAARQRRAFAANTLEMLLLSSVDAAIAMENALMAAESIGLGTVAVGSVRNRPNDIGAELGLPHSTYAVVGLCIGHEQAGTRRGTKPRLPSCVTVHEEQYSTADLEDSITAYDNVMIAHGVYAGRRVAIGEPEDERLAYGWAEHTARRLSNPETLLGPSQSLRAELRSVLEERGFSVQ